MNSFMPWAVVTIGFAIGIGASQQAVAQKIPVHVIVAQFNEASDIQAVAQSVAQYYLSANNLAKIPRDRFIVIEIEIPQTTVYPNRNGTFDAVSNGFVWLAEFGTDENFEIWLKRNFSRARPADSPPRRWVVLLPSD